MKFLDRASLPADLQGGRAGRTARGAIESWLDVSKLPPLPVDDGWIDGELAAVLIHERLECCEVLKKHSRPEALDRFTAEFCRQLPDSDAVHNRYVTWRSMAEELGGPETALVMAEVLRRKEVSSMLRHGAAYTVAAIGERVHIPALALAILRMDEGFYKRCVQERLRVLVQRLKLTGPEVADWLLPDEGTEAENVRLRAGQAERLESAMLAGLRWSVEIFDLRIARHPVMAPLALGVVWGYFNQSDRLIQAFLIDADGSYPAAPEAATVGIVHPAHLSSEEAGEWRERTKKLAAPFAQWKAVAGIAIPEDPSATSLPRLPAKSWPAATLLCRLEALGWKRTKSQTELKFHGRAFPDLGVTAVIEYTGIPLRYGGEWGEQWIRDCFFVANNDKVPLSRVSPIAISTVAGDLEALAGGKR